MESGDLERIAESAYETPSVPTYPERLGKLRSSSTGPLANLFAELLSYVGFNLGGGPSHTPSVSPR